MTLKVRAVILSDPQGHRDAVDMTGFRGDTVNIAETMKGPGGWSGDPITGVESALFFLLHLQFGKICRAEIFLWMKQILNERLCS